MYTYNYSYTFNYNCTDLAAIIALTCPSLPPQEVMPLFPLMHRLCLGNSAVPLVPRIMDFQDLHELTTEGDADDSEFLVLSLKGSADFRWAEKYLKLPARWWARNQSRVPLVVEIQEAIDAKKVKVGFAARLPRLPNVIVAIEARGKVILVQNQRSFMNLAFRAGQEMDGVHWFLEQLQKDLEQLQGPSETLSNRLSKSQQPLGSTSEHRFVEESIRELKDHPNCHSAVFLPSRSSFRVTKSNKSSSEFYVSGLKRKRQQDDEEAMQAMFQVTVTLALKFLSGDVPLAPLTDGDDSSEV